MTKKKTKGVGEKKKISEAVDRGGGEWSSAVHAREGTDGGSPGFLFGGSPE